MNQNNRFCKVEGHGDLLVSHICTVENCNKQSRWICSECLIMQIHDHDHAHDFFGRLKQVLTKNDLIIKFQRESEQNQIKKNQIKIQVDEILSSIQKLEQSLFNLTNQINNIKQYTSQIIDNYQQKLQQLIQQCQGDQFYQIDEKKFQEILMPICLINQNQHNNCLNELQTISNLMSLIQDQQLKFHNIMNNNLIIDLKNTKYSELQIFPEDYPNNHFCRYQTRFNYKNPGQLKQYQEICFGCSISNDEKYIAYGIQNNLLIIQNLQQSQMNKQNKDDEKEIQLPGGCSCCQFTENSQQLFVGVSNGYINQYDRLKDFILLNQLKIHTSDIFNIIPINDNIVITASADNFIIKTNLANKQQLFNLKGHDNNVFTLQLYNQDILISGSGDQSIKFWNCNDKTILIDQKYAHKNAILQIQLINANSKLISLCRSGQVYIWLIDFINKSLSKVSQFYDINHIYNFSSVMDDQYLLFICSYYIQIIDQNGQVIKYIDHKAGPNSQNLDLKQLNNMELILIRSKDKIIIKKIQR